jgi:predicted O-methyltransferase YrrM
MAELNVLYNQMVEADRAAVARLCTGIRSEFPIIVEIGCWAGNSSAIFAEHIKKHGGQLVCIDTFQGSLDTELMDYAKQVNMREVFDNNMKELGLSEYITVLQMTSDLASEEILNESVDLVFIDGDHMYDQVKKDIANYYPKVKKGGIISGHDLNAQMCDIVGDITEPLKHNCVDNCHFGVTKAVWEAFGEVGGVVQGSSVWYTIKNK